MLIGVNGFCYDVTIKLYQHHVIKRVTYAVDTCWMLLMYSIYFVVVTLLFQLLAKHSSAALPSKRFVNKRLTCLFIIATPHYTQTVSFATINLFSLFNTTAKTNHIDHQNIYLKGCVYVEDSDEEVDRQHQLIVN